MTTYTGRLASGTADTMLGRPLTCLFVLTTLLWREGATAAVQGNAKFRDCQEWWEAGERHPGIYTIFPVWNDTKPYKVLCNHTATGSSTVIQQRRDGAVSFALPFLNYKIGFGHPATDYWIGLDAIHHLTTTGVSRLHILMQDWNGQWRSISYGHFSILDQSGGYRLTIAYPSGNVPDDLSYHNGMYFYTRDYPDVNKCAVNMQAGWWYNYCAYSLLNGRYYYGGPYIPHGGYYDGIFWRDWLGNGYSMKYVQMAVSR